MLKTQTAPRPLTSPLTSRRNWLWLIPLLLLVSFANGGVALLLLIGALNSAGLSEGERVSLGTITKGA